MGPTTVAVILGVYALLLIAGGAMGYVKARSKPSLIAGTISGIVGLIAAVLATTVGPKLGVQVGLGLSALMILFFGPRFLRSKKFMPAGLMAILSILVAICMIVALLP